MTIRERDQISLDRLAQLRPDLNEVFDSRPDLPEQILLVTRASAFLSRLLFTEKRALDIMANLNVRPEITGSSADDLTMWKRFELLRIAARDLTRVDSVDTVGANLAQLADDVLTGAQALVPGAENLVIIGMGKLAGQELNYASDIDVMFVGDVDDRIARQVMTIARRSFRVDAALRPEGGSGALVRSLDAFEQYWQKWASPWEFQALLKSRPITGPVLAQEAWLDTCHHALWNRRFGVEELRSLRSLKARSELLLAQRGLTDREVKRGRGGIRDVEFAVQLLQLVHGPDDEAVRSSNTLTALRQLRDGGYIAAEDEIQLSDSYRFLRTVEHRLQLVEEQQTHTLPTDASARRSIARSMGYVAGATGTELDHFDSDVTSHQSSVRTAHERLYFRPLLEAFAQSNTLNQQASERLAAFGFREAERTREAVRELTRGLTRSSRLMAQMMPLLLDWLSASPDPDGGLFGLRRLVSSFRTPAGVIALFRESPAAAQRLCTLLGTGPLFGELFAKHPDALSFLADTNELLTKKSTAERMEASLGWRKDGPDRDNALHRFVRGEQLRIAAADVLGLSERDQAQPGARRSDLVDAVIQFKLQEFGADFPVAVIGMGRYGGKEMSYASDVDVMLVHDGTASGQQARAEQLAQHLKRSIGGTAPPHRLFVMDFDLRPEGRNGPMAKSFRAYSEYYDKWASTWERQALVRARVVAGDPNLGARFLERANTFAFEGGLSATELRDIRQLKARMERERLPKGQDPRLNLKLGPGGLSDVEWTVQILQLQNGVEGFNTLESIQKLRSAQILDGVDADLLEEAWRFCDRVRNTAYLISGKATDVLPVPRDRYLHLCRALDIDPATLNETHLQLARRARMTMERLFYGNVEA